jgi:hypothetical protein
MRNLVAWFNLSGTVSVAVDGLLLTSNPYILQRHGQAREDNRKSGD